MEVLEEKEFKEFGQFVLYLLVKITYLPDLKKKISKDFKVMAQKNMFMSRLSLN